MTPSSIRDRRGQALQRQIARLQTRRDGLARLSRTLSTWRLLLFTAAFAAAGALFFQVGPLPAGIAGAVGVVLFSLVALWHRRVDAGARRYAIWQAHKTAQLARMNLEWPALPPNRPVARPGFDHPFANDLNLFGEHSLMRLIDITTTGGGRARLVSWLTGTAPNGAAPNGTAPTGAAAAGRQRLVRELAPKAAFRARLQLQARLAAGDDGAPGRPLPEWDAAALFAWLEKDESVNWLPWFFGGLFLLGLTWIFYLLALGPPLDVLTPAALVAYVVLILYKQSTTGDVFREASRLRDALEQLQGVFALLEQHNYHDTPALKALCEPFWTPAQRPSRHLRQVVRVVNATGLRGNPALAILLNLIFPWDFFFAYQLARCKRALKTQVPAWLDAWYELEGLNTLANIAYLNPDYAWPTIVDDAWPPLTAADLGHPLLPPAARVCNDFTFAALGDVGLITGSNMSGKSTFLRALGMNLALAYAGGPVAAGRFEVRLLRLFTAIQIQDSVTDGISYFYAEVRRLQALRTALADESGPPLIFLIDEIFRGTNNRERLIGSQAYVRAITGQTGVGLISTHDLELVSLADDLPALRNYHFRDDIAGERMVFDYRLRPGPCPTTNALRIMALAGLPVTVDG